MFCELSLDRYRDQSAPVIPNRLFGEESQVAKWRFFAKKPVQNDKGDLRLN